MEETRLDLTNPQKSIWLTQQFYENSTINNIAGDLRIEVPCDFVKLEKAFNLFVKNNDAFRIRVILTENGPEQYVSNYQYESIPIIDITNINELDKIEENFVKEAFDVIEKRLFNVKFVRLPDNKAIILLNLHHLISDAWTMIFCLNEVYKNYIELLGGKNEIDFEENPSYIEFIESQKEYLNSSAFQKDKEFWEDKFSVLPDYISFKSDMNTGIVSKRKEYTIDSKTMEKVNQICSDNKISAYVLFLSIFTVYFRNIFNSNCYAIGNPVLNRSNFRQKHTAGMFVSVEPFIVDVNDNDTFIEHAQKIAKEQLSMYRHLKYPYDELYKFVKEKHKSNNKLFDIVFSYQNAKIDMVDSNLPISANWFGNYNQVESLMVHMKDTEKSGDLSIFYDYLIDCLTDNQVEEMHSRILAILNQILDNEFIALKDLEIVSESEKNKLLYELNQTESKYQNNSNLVKEFEKIAQKYPNNIAVSYKDKKITYKELNERANALANKILDTKIDTDIVAFEMHRSIDMIIAVWGILKSGHTYMPIDPEYPEDRKKVMIESSKAKILVTNKEMYDSISFAGEKIVLDDNKEIKNLGLDIEPSKLAYIMYTSGSTGVPKAVTIRHENVLNFVASMHNKLNYNVDGENKVLSVTTVCFDIFVFELFPTLLSGLEMVIASEIEARSPQLLNEIIVNKKITKILTTPSRIQLLFLQDEYLECLQVLKEIILGGEPFPKQLLLELNKLTKARIYNLYGPTETTVYSCFKELTGKTEITIGKPIANTQVYLWNDNNKLVPFGTIGEIVIGGDGVGSGYYKNEEITKNVFVENPYKEHDIVYKTGDFGKWNEDGDLTCLGRKDYQVKIRGYRIELDDISNHILTFPKVEKAVVTDREDSNGKKYLCAYFVAEEKINTTDLKKYLTDKLPNYMVPTHFMQLDEMPLTINHKINRKALPEPVEEQKEFTEIIEPKTETQKILCDILKTELKEEKIGINSDLFDYQIDSLDIIRIQTKLLPYNFNLNTQDFYECRTIEKLSERIQSHKRNVLEFNPEELKDINKCMNNSNISFGENEYKCVLLTGCTGYLGMQILHEILKTTKETHIIALTRSKKDKTAIQRNEELYTFYFNEPIDYTRVEFIDTDITETMLGLNKEQYMDICNKVDLVINCAANVRYYGKYETFKKVNVDITQNLIDFCKQHDILFAHISTLGICGNYLVGHTNESITTFDENDFYIGQNYFENVYIHTKFEAEKRIYENVKNNGLKAIIFRVGNLTGRYSDGCFQKNIEENAFYNILLLILKYRMVPENMLEQWLEFTPVDLCSSAVVKILWNTNSIDRVYHIFNHNYMKTAELVNIFKESGFDIKVKTPIEFNKEIMEKIKGDETSLKGVVNDLNSENGLSFNLAINQKNEISNEVLSKLDFKWFKPEKEYIQKIIECIENNLR